MYEGYRCKNYYTNSDFFSRLLVRLEAIVCAARPTSPQSPRPVSGAIKKVPEHICYFTGIDNLYDIPV